MKPVKTYCSAWEESSILGDEIAIQSSK